MFAASTSLLTSLPVALFYLLFFKLDAPAISLLSLSSLVIAVSTTLSLSLLRELNVRVALAALLYPYLYLTLLALLVWRARRWALSFDVTILLLASTLLSLPLLLLTLYLVNSGRANASLWGAFAAGAAMWGLMATFTLGNHMWTRLAGSRREPSSACSIS